MRHKSAAAGLPSGPSGPPMPRENAPSVALRFQIGRVTLAHYTRADQKRFVQSLQSRIAELAQAQGGYDWSAATTQRIARLDAGRLPDGASAEEAARQIATQIFNKLAQGPGGKRHA